MKICWFGFLGKNMSWSLVAQNISRQLISLGHQVDLFSTNGIEYFPEDLKPNLVGYMEENKPETIYGKLPTGIYDCQLSYTAMKNFPYYFSRGEKNRFGIWCYEWNVLPSGFAKQHIYVDKILAPSKFTRDIFIDNKIPEDKVVLVPHGINLQDYQNVLPYKFSTTKSKKILVNIGQPHRRKRIDGMLEAFGLAFNKNDDVCLVAKISAKKSKLQAFEIDVFDLFNKFKKKYPNHAEIELITQYVPNIISLYVACDLVYTLSYTEGFYLPALETLAAKKINVCPNFGGQLDFLNTENSILINGKMIRADAKMQYWNTSPYNGVFEADLEEAANKLKDVVNNYDDYLKTFSPKMEEMVQQYTWENVVNQILNLIK